MESRRLWDSLGRDRGAQCPHVPICFVLVFLGILACTLTKFGRVISRLFPFAGVLNLFLAGLA